MKKLFQEPLLHFVVIGALFFILYGWVNDERSNQETIYFDDYDMDNLIASWEMQWKRLPSQEELKNLVDLNIRQEIFYQEALKMNLDHNDEIIKRRLAQKMQFLSNDLATFKEPTREALQEYYEANVDKYLSPFEFSFYQIVLSPDYRENPVEDAEKLLKEFGAYGPEALEGKGDPLPFPFVYESTDAEALSRQLGLQFTRRLEIVDIGRWTGPIKSGFGVHLVYLKERKDPKRPSFESIERELTRDLEYETQQKVNDMVFEELKKNYRIEFELDPKKFDASYVEFLRGNETEK